MKKLFAAMVILVGCSGCYSENKALIEGGRPVELHLKGMDQSLTVAIPEIDGCEYCFAYGGNHNGYVRIFHLPGCRNCKGHTWPDGQKPLETVEVRRLGRYYITPLEIDGHEFFTAGGWNSYPDDIVHRGHCKACWRNK